MTKFKEDKTVSEKSFTNVVKCRMIMGSQGVDDNGDGNWKLVIPEKEKKQEQINKVYQLSFSMEFPKIYNKRDMNSVQGLRQSV